MQAPRYGAERGARRKPRWREPLSFKLANSLKGSASGIARTIREYERRHRTAGSGKREKASGYREITNLYYDVATDFYEFGWGRSFHFAPRVPGESFKASLARHEHYLAHKLGLGPGMVVADLGCGIGGPLLEIARFSGAKIVGVNSNAYQLERARKIAEEAELVHLAEFMHCDFLDVDAPDGGIRGLGDEGSLGAGRSVDSLVPTAGRFRVLPG